MGTTAETYMLDFGSWMAAGGAHEMALRHGVDSQLSDDGFAVLVSGPATSVRATVFLIGESFYPRSVGEV